ncbi:hypothetical protein SAMN05216360_105262 [Methylobacterium phyllostachyos]|uniref:DUF5672 domain-containing protein n=1 Tax=Methylobacterium phyllostachyos TaxID=582672 RepID=A0A1G9YCH8_9HYPH|nr:hypothetical protein [Methylobacterium phyllostachyos]SDN06808.1 hypothetical protein SAMN05216360_105262 [Methylobacterium phyllostachyos]
MTNEQIIILRTNKFDDRHEFICNRLSTIKGFDFCVAVDETSGAVPIPGRFIKIVIDKDFMTQENLPLAEKAGWACGDYFIYASMLSRRPYRHYWMIEPDVFLRFEDENEFFSLFDDHAEVDFIAAGYDRAYPGWVWSNTMSAYGLPVYGCLFPVVRISWGAANYLLDKRRAPLPGQKLGIEDYPNDEVFCATMLTDAGFNCRNINSFGRHLTSIETFGIRRPYPYNYLRRGFKDGMIYHPAVSSPVLFYKFKHIIEEGGGEDLAFAATHLPHSKDDLSHEEHALLISLLNEKLNLS